MKRKVIGKIVVIDGKRKYITGRELEVYSKREVRTKRADFNISKETNIDELSIVHRRTERDTGKGEVVR